MEKAGTGGVRKRRHARESDQIPRRMGARGVAERETRVGSLLARAREASGIALTCSSPSGGAPLFPATGAMVTTSRSPDSASARRTQRLTSIRHSRGSFPATSAAARLAAVGGFARF